MEVRTFKKFIPPVIVATPRDFTTNINFDVWGTFNFSLDGGATWSAIVSGQPYNVSGVPSANIVVKRKVDGITRISFLNKNYFSSIKIEEEIGDIVMGYGMFQGCASLTSLDLTKFNTSAVTNMAEMFRGCISLTSLNLSSFNTSAVTSMVGMFMGVLLTSLNLSSFNTSAVTSMQRMFRDCVSLTSLNLSSFNTSAVKDMYMMFRNINNLTSLDLSSFNTSAVTTMAEMFRYAASLTYLDLSSIYAGGVTTMNYMFDGCTSLVCITNLNSLAAGTNGGTGFTQNMFQNTPALLKPNATDQANIVAGANWYNGSACP